MTFDLQRELSKECENVVNRLHRHCRIGKVRNKMQIHGGKWVLPPRFLPDPPTPTKQSEWWLKWQKQVVA